MTRKKNKSKKSPATGNSVKLGPAKICLNAIMKNEEHVIERCLDNIGHLLDAVYILDTGSTDNSISLVKKWAEKKSLPCQVDVDPWRDDFGYSRTMALRKGEEFLQKLEASGHWYFMFMDIDNLAYSDDGGPFELNKNRLGYDAYRVNMRSSGLTYAYLWMIKVDPDKKWQWYGPVHEYVSPVRHPQTKENLWNPQYGLLTDGYVESRREGSRSNDLYKYFRDALAFEKALLDDPMNDRHLYYLGQSYRDAANVLNHYMGQEKKKLEDPSLTSDQKDEINQTIQRYNYQVTFLMRRGEEAYHFRASAPPFDKWTDEYTYLAWVEAGKLRFSRKGYFDEKALSYFNRAHQIRSHRLEAPYYLLNYHVKKGSYRVGWLIAKDLINLPYPENDTILIDNAIHQYRFAFEASLCAYYAGNKPKFVELTKQVIANAYTPENIREIAKSNLAKFGK